MSRALYETYLDHVKDGRKREAKAAVEAFVASVTTPADKTRWAGELLAGHRYGGRMRHELFEGIVFPVLWAGCERGDSRSLYGLAGLAQNLYAARALWDATGGTTELALLKRAHALAPLDREIGKALLARILADFAQAAHEWPRGILRGMNGATLDQCDDWQADIRLALALDPEPDELRQILDFQGKLDAFRARSTTGT